MKTTFFGHAVLRVDAPSGASLITDPWFDKNGCFFQSWFQFPENAPFVEAAFNGVDDILLSHNHADHYDPVTLKRFLAESPTRRLHIAQFGTDWFAKRAKRFLPGFEDRIVVHEPWERFKIGDDLSAYFVPERSPGHIDSAIVIESKRQTILNLNDARLDSAQLARIRARSKGVNIVALQASGASEYPLNYLYDSADMKERCHTKRRLKFEACTKVLEQIEPHRVLFFAGPPVFLDPSLAELNKRSDESVFPDQLDVLNHFQSHNPKLAESCYFALPGEELDDTVLWSSTTLDDRRLEPFTRRDDYVKAYRKSRLHLLEDVWNKDGLAEDSEYLQHFRDIAKVSPWINDKIGGTLSFRIRGRDNERTFSLDFRTGEARAGIAEDALYVLTAPASCVHAVMRDEATWDDIFLSMRMTFDERSDKFVAHFKTLLKYLDPGLCKALQAFEEELTKEATEDTFVLEHDGKRYRVQRACPHSGVDLEKNSEVNEDGNLVCMAHRFRFDLCSGKCLTAKGYHLEVKLED